MKSIILICLCTLSLSLFAQEKKKDNYMSGMTMTRSIGISFQNFENLNSRIGAYPQYKPLKDYMWTLGLGSMNNYKNFISGLSVTGGSSLSGNRNKRSSTMRFLSGGLDFGYDVIPAKTVMLYPTVGIGAETYQATFYRDNSAVNFNDVLTSSTVQNNIRSVRFTNSYITYRFGLGFALKSPKDGGMIGLQLGYTGNFTSEKNWKSNENQNLNNAPADNLSRFNIGLVFGGSGHMMMR